MFERAGAAAAVGSGAGATTTALLVVGTARSGTTLTARRVVEVVGGTALPETHFWRSIVGRRPDLLVGARSRRAWIRALLRACDRPEFRDGGFDPAALAARLPDRRLTAIEVWRAVLDGPDGHLVVESTPKHLLWLPALLRQPDHRAIAVVRDPRAQVSSMLRVPFRTTSDAAALALRWRIETLLALELARRHGTRLAIVRYEDVVAGDQPGRALEQLGIRGGPGEGAAALVGPGEHWKALAEAPVDPRRVEGWTAELVDRDRVAVEAVTGDLLGELGYPPPVGANSGGALWRRAALEIVAAHWYHRSLAWLASGTGATGSSVVRNER